MFKIEMTLLSAFFVECLQENMAKCIILEILRRSFLSQNDKSTPTPERAKLLRELVKKSIKDLNILFS